MVDVSTSFEVSPARPIRRPDPGHGPLTQAIWGRVKDVLWPLLLTLVGLTAVYVASTYLPGILSGSHEGSQVLPGRGDVNHVILAVHVLFAFPPLLLGWMGFSKRLRKLSMRFHRWMGTAYCVTIWVSAATGFTLGMAHSNGWATRAGYCSLAVAWALTTWIAYSTARKRDFPAHRRWMIRSYAITLAVVTVRPILFAPAFVDVSHLDWPLITSWCCWLPNVVLAEAYIARTDFRGRWSSKKVVRRPRGRVRELGAR